jgi:hypothetical protein
MSKYKIKKNKNLCILLEYNTYNDDYVEKKTSFNVYSFLEYLKSNGIKKYFSFNEDELIKE